MGIHRQFTGGSAGPRTGPGPGPGDPIPLPEPVPPVGPGKGDEKCDATSELILKISLLPTMISKDAAFLDAIKPGYEIEMHTWTDYSGIPFPPGTDNQVFRSQSGTSTPQTGGSREPNRPRPTGTNPEGTGPGQPNEGDEGVSWPPKTSSEPESSSVPPHGPEKRERYEVKKVWKKVNGFVVEVIVKAENKKEKLTEKKIKKKIGPGTRVKDVVEMVAQECEFDQYFIDDLSVDMPICNINEWYAKEVLDVCALLAGAGYTVTDNALHFFGPESRPHPVPCTTDPNGTATDQGSPESESNPQKYRTVPKDANPIRKDTVKTSEDATSLVNKVQNSNPKDTPQPRVEPFPVPYPQPLPYPPAPGDEIHVSYPPLPPFLFDLVFDSETPLVVHPERIQQDWGDRPLVQHFRDQGVAYTSPSFEGPTTPGSGFIALVNRSEKVFRFIDATTGLPYVFPTASPPYQNSLVIEYYHSDPTFSIVQDDNSIAKWGVRETIHVSPDGQPKEFFKAITDALLRDYSQPLFNIECEVYNDIYRVGDSVDFIIPILGIGQRLCVYQITRFFDPQIRAHYPNRDPGQSVRIKAGAKIPCNISNVLDFLNNRINSLDRAYNLTDFEADTPHHLAVPRECERIYSEELEILEGVVFTKTTYDKGAQINVDRINVGRIRGVV